MKAIFIVCERIGDGKSTDTAWRPYFSGQVNGFSGSSIRDYVACNVFDNDQSILDAISADPRTAFDFPIDVDGTKLDYSDAFEVPANTRGKITAWCAKTYGQEFGNWVAQNAKNRHFVAEAIMRKVSGVPTADALKGFRIWWK